MGGERLRRKNRAEKELRGAAALQDKDISVNAVVRNVLELIRPTRTVLGGLGLTASGVSKHPLRFIERDFILSWAHPYPGRWVKGRDTAIASNHRCPGYKLRTR